MTGEPADTAGDDNAPPTDDQIAAAKNTMVDMGATVEELDAAEAVLAAARHHALALSTAISAKEAEIANASQQAPLASAETEKPALEAQGAGSAAPTPAAVASPNGDLPFTVEQSHAIDSMAIGTVATKLSPSAIAIDQPDKGKAEHPVVASDVVAHLPTGATIQVMEAPASPTGKQVAITLPGTAKRPSPFTIIAQDVHTTMAKAWKWIKDEAEAIV